MLHLSLKFSSAYYCDVLSSAVGDEERRAVSRESEESSVNHAWRLSHTVAIASRRRVHARPSVNGMCALSDTRREEEGDWMKGSLGSETGRE